MMYAPESHTAENLALFGTLLVEHGLYTERMVAVTTDSAANIIAACANLQVTRMGWFGHILHNAANNALNTDNITALLRSACKIVSVFSYSFKYRNPLSKVQRELNLPLLSPSNNLTTRWESKEKILSRLQSQLSPATDKFFMNGMLRLVI